MLIGRILAQNRRKIMDQLGHFPDKDFSIQTPRSVRSRISLKPPKTDVGPDGPSKKLYKLMKPLDIPQTPNANFPGSVKKGKRSDSEDLLHTSTLSDKTEKTWNKNFNLHKAECNLIVNDELDRLVQNCMKDLQNYRFRDGFLKIEKSLV
jgi:hypothetical protein